MGNALVVTTVAEENLAVAWARDPNGKEIRLALDWRLKRKELLTRYPDAYFRLDVPVADVWEMPAEPPVKPAVLDATHGVTVRRSLHRFLNERIARLAGMIRSGRWVLGHARVRVTACDRAGP